MQMQPNIVGISERVVHGINSMKVLHFSSAQTWRGGEQQIAYLFEELEKLGVQQWIFCKKGSELAAHCLYHNWPHFTYWKGFSINPFIGFQLKNLCTQLNVDLVHICLLYTSPSPRDRG